MPNKHNHSPRPSSSIDAKSIKIPPACSSSETQDQSLTAQHSAISDSEQLLDALWRSPDYVHQIGTLDRRNHHFRNIPVKNSADALAQAQKLSSDGQDVFLACAEYHSPDTRVAANASSACAFWLDVDCGEDKAAAGKGYANVEEAEVTLSKFCEDSGLPRPTHIVHSGGGLHIYWVLDDAVSHDIWQAHARQLKDLTKACGFLADDSRTADIASVLRIPGTFNHKYSPPRSVTLSYTADEFIELSAMLDAIENAHARLCNKEEADPADNSNRHDYGPPDLKKLKSALATLDPDCDEKTWKFRRLAPLAQAARDYPQMATELRDLGRSWSSGELAGKPSKAWTTPGGNGLTGEQAFDDVWNRFYEGQYTGTPVTLGTIYHDAKQAGWAEGTDTEAYAPVEAAQQDDAERNNLPFPVIEPWPDPVDPASLLNELSATIRRFVVMTPEQADAATLWISFTWLIDAVEVAPLAIINAPEKACGKSMLLEVMGRMSAKPLSVANATTAALFRSVERWGTTVLIDEVDTFIRENKELKGIINAGHTRANAYVLRTVGDQHEPKQFTVWSPKALAGISLEKHLPDSTMSRAIVFNLRRKLPHENVERLRHAEPRLFMEIASKLARFSQGYAQQVRQARPTLPEQLSDRAQDNWEPLLAIAGCADQEWVNRATAAALKLSGERDETASIGNELLADIQHVFARNQVEKISTSDLIDALVADEEKLWSTFNHGKPITPRQLSKLLSPYNIKPKTVRFGKKTPKGYEVAQFTDAFARYLPPSDDLPQRRNDSPKSNNRMAAGDADEVSEMPSTGETQEFTRVPICGGVADVSGDTEGASAPDMPPLGNPEDLI